MHVKAHFGIVRRPPAAGQELWADLRTGPAGKGIKAFAPAMGLVPVLGGGDVANYRAALDQRRVRHREPLALVPGLCVFGDAADQEKEPEHKSYCSGGQHVHLPFRRRPGAGVISACNSTSRVYAP